nr:MAG TPA: hypothetical protein [Caudoviricetes sp.]
MRYLHRRYTQYKHKIKHDKTVYTNTFHVTPCRLSLQV